MTPAKPPVVGEQRWEHAHWFDSAPWVFAGAALIIALLVMLGWAVDSEVLKSVIPGEVTMKFNAAAGLFMLAVARLLRLPSRPGELRSALGRTLAATAFAVGALTLSQDLFGWTLGLDGLVVREPEGAVGTAYPGRMAPTTALSLMLLGAAAAVRPSRRRVRLALDAAALGAVAVSVLALLGYLYGVRPLFAFELYTSMALHTAVALVLLALATLLQEAAHGLMAPVLESSPPGLLIRILAPAAFLVPATIAGLRLTAERAGYISPEGGVALGVSGNIIVFSFLIGWSAWRLALSERERVAAVEERMSLELERKARQQAISTIVHDLRGPLSTAKLRLEILARDSKARSLDRTRLSQVSEGLARIERMVSDLLDAARLESGLPLRLLRTPFDLRELIIDTLEELATTAGDRFELTAHEEASGHWDREALRRLLENLCRNALKFGSPASPIGVRLGSDRRAVYLAVHNDGPPIPAEEQDAIFEPFRQGGGSVDKPGGWGIGLFLVRSVAEAHGGRVRVESAPGSGTTFVVTLPRVSGRPDEEAEQPEPQPSLPH